MEGVRTVLRLDEKDLRPRLEPEPGQCCVKFCGLAVVPTERTRNSPCIPGWVGKT